MMRLTRERASIRNMIRTIGVMLAIAAVASPVFAEAQRPPRRPIESYQSAAIDADGNLLIVTSAGRRIVVPKIPSSTAHALEGAQTAFDEPVISDDRSAVAAAALFHNCCTSYDIPLQLVVYSGGKIHRFEGSLPIFDWHFEEGGRRIAFSQETVHFACSIHWELRDVRTERRLEEVDIPEPCGENPNPPKVIVPKWVKP